MSDRSSLPNPFVYVCTDGVVAVSVAGATTLKVSGTVTAGAGESVSVIAPDKIVPTGPLQIGVKLIVLAVVLEVTE